jgi:hypothetical protein
MAALCAVSDVEALAGFTIPSDQTARVNTLIEMASAVVAAACVPLPAVTPTNVSTTTAGMVVRTLANPTEADKEGLGTYNVSYTAPNMTLTDADYARLGAWVAVEPGHAAYSVMTPSPYAVDDYGYDPFVYEELWWPGLPADRPQLWSAAWRWLSGPSGGGTVPAGFVGVDTLDPTNATLISVSAIDGDGIDRTLVLQRLGAEDGLLVRSQVDSSVWFRFVVPSGSIVDTTPTGSTFLVPVELVEGTGGEPAQGDVVDVTIGRYAQVVVHQ